MPSSHGAKLAAARLIFDRVKEFYQRQGKPLMTDEQGITRDADGSSIENFGFHDNRMLEGAVRLSNSTAQTTCDADLKLGANRVAALGNI
jgi:nucleoside 2-deoxyribosyltransferase